MRCLFRFLHIILNGDILNYLRPLYWHWLKSRNSSTKAWIAKPLIFTAQYIRWGNNVTILNNSRIEGIKRYEGIEYFPQIFIHDNVSIQQNCHITCASKIEIGENTAIASNVTITDIDHPYEDINLPIERQQLIVKPVSIGKNCKIYNNAVILQGTKIGNHCVVGANSVVKGTFPDFSILVGAPARIVKRYDFEYKEWRQTDADGSFKI